MVDKYTIFQRVIGENRLITLNEMEDDIIQPKLCEDVMDFQISALCVALEHDGMMEYLKYENDEDQIHIGKFAASVGNSAILLFGL